MPKYIDADEFVRLKREWYCEQCEKRKGMKRGRLQFVYEIGDAPCRACNVDDMISDIEDFPAADVEPVRHGRWIDENPASFWDPLMHCSVCGEVNIPLAKWRFCPMCGAKMDAELPKGEDDDNKNL
jgi:NADH pyrophosphatase NudC (nudix superfamily)